jgi:hypothetical protein
LQPHLAGATFVGVDNFYYTASALGLSTSKGTSLDDFDKAAGTLCASSWSHIKAHYLKNHKGDPADSYHAKVGAREWGSGGGAAVSDMLS